MSKLIELNHIVKHYGKLCVLNDVSISLRPGVTGLLGPNGAGKSTLIKVMLGLLRLTSGSGTIMGLDLMKSGREIRDLIGYMPEDDSYIPGMSGVEVVRYAACLSGLPSMEGLRRAHEILDYCDVGQERYRDVETYSTGMRQKTKVAQAIVADPPILIFDEPTSGLDPEARESMLNRIRNLYTQHGKTIVVSTHILRDVQQICDDVIIMANGRVKVSDAMTNLAKPMSPQLRVTVDSDPQEFCLELQRAGVECIHQPDGELLVTVDDEGGLPNAVWRVARTSRHSIQSIVPTRHTLEQIFREAVGEDARAG